MYRKVKALKRNGVVDAVGVPTNMEDADGQDK